MAFDLDAPAPTAIGRIIFSVDDVDGQAPPKLGISGEFLDVNGAVLYRRYPAEVRIIAELTPQERAGLLNIMTKFRAAFVASLPP